MKKLVLSLLLSVIFSWAQAQIIWLVPANPSVNDSVTLFYNAAEGNKALMDLNADVYLHTGVITNRSLDGHDWKYVVGNWGKDDKSVLMKREGKNLYSFRFVISPFYKLRPEDVAQQLAYVFRNADGTLVGKTAAMEDILVPVNGYKPPAAGEQVAQNREIHKLEKLEQLADRWLITTDKGVVTVRPYSTSMLEVTFLPKGETTVDSSHSVVMKPVANTLSSKQTPAGYILQTGDMSVGVTSEPFHLTYLYKSDTLLSEESGFFKNKENSGVRLALKPGEKVYGAGERAVAMDRRGKKFQLYNRPFYGYEYGAQMLNFSMPLTFSSRKYAILFDNPQKGTVDIGATEPGVTEWCAIGGTARYYVIAGNNFHDISTSYTALTGRQPLPPRWALGNLQSRMAYRNQTETDSIVTLMRKQNFPVDAVILDFYWFGDSIQGHLGKLDWYRKAWPDPEGMIAKFRKQGIKTILITEPYVIDTVANWKDAAAKGVFVTDSLGKPYLDKQFYFGTGSLIDIFKPEAREWFWQKYDKQIQKGIAGWWGDLGEPESHPKDIHHVIGTADQVHNIYGHYWDKMLSENYARYYPSTRLFHLQRSGFAGSQRFSAYPWTGDVSRSWGGFQAQLPLLLTMSISGMGYIHSDAGGFAQGVADDELYTRWLQFATFTPILRPHGSNIPSEPVFWSEKTQDIVRSYMNLRYAMLPYNYTLAWQNATTGAPLMRPLFYQFPSDPQAAAIEDQYCWGDNMMIAPVIYKNLNSRKIYLPEGAWFDYFTGKQYSGKQTIDYPLSIENIPVFVKGGSFIPETRPVKTTDAYRADNYTVKYYPYGTSEFVQYEDNGLDRNAIASNKFELITYKGSLGANRITIEVSKTGKWDKMPRKRKMTLEVITDRKPVTVLINGRPAKQMRQKGSFKSKVYNADNKQVNIYFTWTGKPVTIELNNQP